MPRASVSCQLTTFDFPSVENGDRTGKGGRDRLSQPAWARRDRVGLRPERVRFAVQLW